MKIQINIDKLNETLNIAEGQQPLREDCFYEMSMAVIDKQKHRNIWVENPNSYANKSDTEYFKYGDKENYTLETKCCRISLKDVKFIYHTNHPNNQGKVKDWDMTTNDKKELVKILQEPWKQHPELTNWQKILFTYNQDRFTMDEDEFINNTWKDEDYPKAFRIDYPMPDYLSLEFDKNSAKNQIAKR